MPENTTKLFSVEVTVTLPGNKREISFSLSKFRQENLAERWFIEFSLKEKIGSETIIRVSVKVEILSESKVKAAAKVVENGTLTQEKTKFLLGKVQATAAAMPAGTTNASPEFQVMLNKVI